MFFIINPISTVQFGKHFPGDNVNFLLVILINLMQYVLKEDVDSVKNKKIFVIFFFSCYKVLYKMYFFSILEMSN